MSGSIPFGKMIGKYYDVDVQKEGSGNIGFANVARLLGVKVGMIVLIGDILKGYIPTIVALQFVSYDWVLIVALAAVLGHIFPAWLGFKGGKGVATGLGVTLAFNPLLGGVGFAAYFVTFLIVRRSAYSSVVAAVVLPVASFWVEPDYFLLALLLAAIALWTHRQNIVHVAGVLNAPK